MPALEAGNGRGSGGATMLTEANWNVLVSRIAAHECTPFLGAGACAGVLPLGSEVAAQWSHDYDYPLDGSSDLARVAQYLAVEYDPMFPKEEFVRQFLSGVRLPDFDDPFEPHAFLAALPLRLYLTRIFDDLMFAAVKHRGRSPRRAVCCWNTRLRGMECPLDSSPPTVEEPVVFYLHGWQGVPESLVLTEDDYLNYLVAVSQDPQLLQPVIKEALSAQSLLFMGYSLGDWSFRVLLHGLVGTTESSLRRLSVTVQLPPIPPNAPTEVRSRVEQYLADYFGRMDMRVYWGDARSFARELSDRRRKDAGHE